MPRAGKIILILLLVSAGLVLLFWLYTGGLYTEEGTDSPDTVRIAGPVMTRRFSDGEEDFRAFILIYPDFSAPFGRLRIVTPFADEYPFRSSELLWYDLLARRVVLSSLAYDHGVVETGYRRG